MQEDQYAVVETSLYISDILSSSSPNRLLDSLPNIPTMMTTRLRLELLLQEPSIDLSAVSEVILSDPGATLQLLRLIGEEYPNDEDRPTRIEDCIVSFNSNRWYEVVCALSIPQSSHVLAHWEYWRRVAQCARELAKCVDGLSPEEAYLVGLLSQLGTLPHILGWNNDTGSSAEHSAVGVMLADYWHLPTYFCCAIQELQSPASSSRWGEILQMAQAVAIKSEPAAFQD
ncbi:HDOD domain-containing protein [Granulicella tundricola]|uniref:Putative signal transduction protein n=1 Tax=Granulicella tundricola (strain ATCC BAA-1859 / DSM 23138 / MP5ACTX9) TaxID=1198114 RepID=E8X624_GRATM|nr:HDOD domain-containing protein [Granulicella tundricola]ADW70908.1 putative signal transduction protein [Granulicella tundricola MP5ACTX9]